MLVVLGWAAAAHAEDASSKVTAERALREGG
jgi:hypothetical protein